MQGPPTPSVYILLWLESHEQQWLFRQQLVRLLHWCTAAWLWPGNKTAENRSQSRPLNYPVPVAAQSTHAIYITSLYTTSIYSLHGRTFCPYRSYVLNVCFYENRSPWTESDCSFIPPILVLRSGLHPNGDDRKIHNY